MGRIKSLVIKRAAKQLLDGKHNFTTDFAHNKKLLDDTMPSKPIRNRIAGLITRLMKAKLSGPKKAKAEAAEQIE